MSTITDIPALDINMAIYTKLCNYIETKESFNRYAGAFLETIIDQLCSFDDSLDNIDFSMNADENKRDGMTLSSGEYIDLLISSETLSGNDICDDNVKQMVRIFSNRGFMVSRQSGHYYKQGKPLGESSGKPRYRSIVKNMKIEDLEIPGHIYNFTSRKGTFMLSQKPFATIYLITFINNLINNAESGIIKMIAKEKFPSSKERAISRDSGWIANVDQINLNNVRLDENNIPNVPDIPPKPQGSVLWPLPPSP